MTTHLRIATRGSKLALWQAEHIRSRLMALHPALSIDLVTIKTAGDRIVDRPLSEVGGKGLFVKEIEEALLDGRADLAVHSLKDLPAELPPALMLGAVPAREDARDALIVRQGLAVASVLELPRGARIGTSSLRRMCQLRTRRPDLEVISLRGNVDTRLRRMAEGALDAIVLAAAGLTRLGLADHIAAYLAPEEMLPAIGQGALGIEVRKDDTATRLCVGVLDDPVTAQCVAAERAFLERLSGTCRTPLAAHAVFDQQGGLHLAGLVGRPDGSEVLRLAMQGTPETARSLGIELAQALLARGADRILADATA